MKGSNRPFKELIIQSSVKNLPNAVKFVEKESRKAGMSKDDVLDFSIVASEAIGNAIKHGNKLNESKKVIIQTTYGKKTLCLSVMDEGEGFNPASVKNPLSPENLQRQTGRGILIMKSLADKVKYRFRGTGTEICIFKRISKLSNNSG